MKYKDKNGKVYLIYCYSPYKNTWKIEKLPFDGTISVVSEKAKDEFIRRNRLVEEVSE